MPFRPIPAALAAEIVEAHLAIAPAGGALLEPATSYFSGMDCRLLRQGYGGSSA